MLCALLLALVFVPVASLEAQAPESGGVWAGLEMEDLQGRSWRSSDLLGRVVLLDFWATWCAPCLDEFPNLRRIHRELDGVTVLGISVDRTNRSELRSFLLRHELSWPQVPAAQGLMSPLAKRFGVDAVPRTVVIDAKGRLVAVDLRGEALYVLLRDLSRVPSTKG
ncbi:MAG: TlpA disulfide reductase family protein [Acidobacteriota bacterium]